MSKRLLYATLLAIILAPGLLLSQDRRAIFSLVGRTDTSGNLYVVSDVPGAVVDTRAIGNLVGRTDASGNLYVALAGAQALTNPMTVTIDGIAAGPATTPSDAVVVRNTTAATVGVPAQWSPVVRWIGQGWDLDDAVSRNADCYWTLRPVSGNTVTAQMQLMCQVAAAGYNQALAITNTGQANFLGAITLGASSAFAFSGRAAMTSTADGLIHASKNDGTIGSTIKVDALPTIASGFGTSPSVTALSTPFAGSVNVGTGGTATSGVINFNGTAFPSAPFCLAGDTTSNIAVRASATTTQLTLTVTVAWSASDVVTWHCISPK